MSEEFHHSRFEPPPCEPEFERRRNMDAVFAGLERRLIEHMDGVRDELRKEFRSAYPNDDPVGHRQAHELMIRSANRWENFKFSVFEHIVKAGGLILAGYIALALWEYFKRGVNN